MKIDRINDLGGLLALLLFTNSKSTIFCHRDRFIEVVRVRAVVADITSDFYGLVIVCLLKTKCGFIFTTSSD